MNHQEQLAESARQTIDHLRGAGAGALDAAEALSALAINAAKTHFEEMAKLGQALAASRTPESAANAAREFAAPAIERGMSFARSLWEISASAASKAGDKAEQALRESHDRGAKIIESVSKSAPAGADAMVSAAKMAHAAAGNAIDNASKAAKKAAEVCETNVAAATAACAKAAGAFVNKQ